VPGAASDVELAVAALVAVELSRHLRSPSTRARLRAERPDIVPDVIDEVIERYIEMLDRRAAGRR